MTDKAVAGAPYFSVLIPVHNRVGGMMERAIASVRQQTDQDFEIVIVDDGSTDGSAEVAAELLKPLGSRGKLRRLPENLGIPGARNATIEEASGTIAAFLDSDDVWHPRFLSVIRAAYAAYPDAIFAFTDYYSRGPRFSGPVQQFGPAPEIEAADPDDPIERMVLAPYIHTMSCFTAPLADLRAIGGFNTDLQRFSDLDLYIRLLGGTGRTVAWKRRPMLALGQSLVLKEIHLKDRPLEGYVAAWEKNKQAFLNAAFSYSFLKRKARRLKPIASARLDEGQKKFFRNFTEC